MAKVARTVIVPSIVLTKKKYEVLKELEEMYKQMVMELVEHGFRHGIKSFTGLKKHMYRILRDRYPQLPSHYVHTACQDAATRIKSFLELKKRGRVYTEKPAVREVSIWLDDHLWKPLGYTAIRVATHKGWIVIELQPHKLYWKYINTGWRLRTQPKLKLDHRERRIYVYFVFEKDVEEYKPRGWIAVDVNENNVTVLVDGKAYKLVTMLRKTIERYHEHRKRFQEKLCIQLNGKKYPLYTLWRRKMSRLRERDRKTDWRRKVAVAIVKTAESLGYGIIVEKLPKRVAEKMINGVRNSELRRRIYQAAFRGTVKAIRDVAEKHGVPVVEVDPRYTSQTCPLCGFRPMTRRAGRVMVCPLCGFSHDRDVIACMNLLMRLVDEGAVPLPLRPMSPRPEVAVLPMRAWAEANPLEATLKETKLTGMTL
ncbi:MAG: transposase [Thermoprotei archaeon]|nr:MAG: transposase [Thermoprotei archaeon]